MTVQTILRAAAAAAAVLLCGAAGARGDYVRGQINGWGTANPMATNGAFTGDAYYSATVTCTQTWTNVGFKVDLQGDWTTNWGTGTSSTNAVVNSTIGSGHKSNTTGSDGGNLTYSQTNGMKYTFRMQGDHTWWYRPYVIMATTNNPVSVLTVADNSAAAVTNTVTVTATLSAATSGEGVYVRWTTNSFANSALAIGSVSGTNVTLTIPAQPTGRTVKYYVLTSPMPTNRILSDYDLCTLRGNNSAGTNFAYVVGTPESVFGNCWHFPTNVEPGTVTMRNPTNPTPGANTYVYAGNYYEAGVGGADMTGGWVFYKKSTDGAWSSNSLAWDSNAGFNQYWIGMIPSNAVALGETLQYYLQVNYANGGADTTYLGTTTQADNVKYAQATNAAAHPFAATSAANLGNAWHVPANAEPTGAYMRNPRHPYATNTVTIYNGNQFTGSGTTGNQSGGTLYYRLHGAGSWSNAALAFDSESGNNKYWKAAISSGTFGKTQAVDYVLAITYTDRDPTYLGTTDQSNTVKYAALASAQSNAYAFTYGGDPGTEPGYVWHGGNVVRLASDTVQIWTKIGYEATNGYRWADHAEVRYLATTQSVSKRTLQGVSRLSRLKSAKTVSASDLTSTNAMSFSHTEPDSSANGNAMWWVATVQDPALTNLNAVVQYQVAAWNSVANGGNGVVRLAEYQADGVSGEIFEYRMYSGGAGDLTVNGQSADYTTTKFFIDEAASETATVTARYTPPAGSVNVEVFSNVGRRDRVDADWNGDGVPDGIKPPDGNLITTNDTTAYFAAFPMTYNGGAGAYEWTTNAGKCGAYRLTARYQTPAQAGSTNWTWYSSEGRRDHAIVLSPKKVLQQTMYELNALTAKASNNTESGRSTFDDLIDPQHATNVNTFNEFSIEYLDKIQANCLWFQPIHPSGVDRSENDPGTGVKYEPGSPYASRNYFAVNPAFGRAGGTNEAAAMTEFTNFVSYCDRGTNRLGSTNHIGTINVMLDGVFNHTSWDAEFGEMGVTMGLCSNKAVKIGTVKPGWYSRMDDYGLPADNYVNAWTNNYATAPDRGDFGKWADVTELYYGKYSCLVRHNPDNNGDYLNEQDVYDFAGMSADTIDLWKYIGRYTEYWLQKTGNSLTNRPGQVDAKGIAYDDYGIDGLRCDFGQGLPPQLWEYIINRTRNLKWNFMFMAETLDGGVPGYRSNRHFDILNENMVFQFTQAHVSDPASLRSQLESRRTAYSGGAILLNLTGHDEMLPWSDPWVTASRYAMVSAVMGVPMVFYGQEQGIGPYAGTADKWTGFTNFELNFGKNIPHFKKWNQLRVWNEPPLDAASREMAQWHGRVNWARHNSPALQSPNQYFLSRTGGGDNTKIFAVAKYEQSGAVASGKDAVLAFALFVNAGDHSGSSDTYDLTGCWSLLGLVNSATNYYNVRNLASSDATAKLWATARSGADLYANGIWVNFPSDTGGNIYDNGAIVQYLKIEPADAPSTALRIAFNPASPLRVPYKELAQFTVSVTDTNSLPVAGVVTSLVTSVPGATFTGGQFSYTVTNVAWIGATNGVQFSASNTAASTSAWMNIVVPADSNTNGIPDVWERTYFTNYNETGGGQADDDGVPNGDEYIANTDPADGNDYFHFTGFQSVTSPVGRTIAINAEPDRAYRIEFATTPLTNNPLVWTPFQAAGAWTNLAPYTNRHVFTDDGTSGTSGSSLGTQRTYRVWVGIP